MTRNYDMNSIVRKTGIRIKKFNVLEIELFLQSLIWQRGFEYLPCWSSCRWPCRLCRRRPLPAASGGRTAGRYRWLGRASSPASRASAADSWDNSVCKCPVGLSSALGPDRPPPPPSCTCGTGSPLRSPFGTRGQRPPRPALN